MVQRRRNQARRDRVVDRLLPNVEQSATSHYGIKKFKGESHMTIYMTMDMTNENTWDEGTLRTL